MKHYLDDVVADLVTAALLVLLANWFYFKLRS